MHYINYVENVLKSGVFNTWLARYILPERDDFLVWLLRRGPICGTASLCQLPPQPNFCNSSESDMYPAKKMKTWNEQFPWTLGKSGPWLHETGCWETPLCDDYNALACNPVVPRKREKLLSPWFSSMISCDLPDFPKKIDFRDLRDLMWHVMMKTLVNFGVKFYLSLRAPKKRGKLQ